MWVISCNVLENIHIYMLMTFFILFGVPHYIKMYYLNVFVILWKKLWILSFRSDLVSMVLFFRHGDIRLNQFIHVPYIFIILIQLRDEKFVCFAESAHLICPIFHSLFNCLDGNNAHEGQSTCSIDLIFPPLNVNGFIFLVSNHISFAKVESLYQWNGSKTQYTWYAYHIW